MIDAINLFAQLWWDWMATISWQVGLLIVFIACIDRLLRRWAWPQLRYALWSLVLIKLLLPPTFALPSALTPRLKPLLDKAIVSTALSESPKASKIPALEALANVSTVTMVRPEPRVVTAPNPAAVEAETVVSVSGPGLVALFVSALNWRVYVMAVWAAGVLVLGAFLAIRLYWLSKGSGSGSADGSLPESFYNRMQCCARRLELRRLPRVVVTENLSCPAVFGVFRPVLLMPKNYLVKLSGQDVEHMLLHELAHIKRGDLIMHGLFMCLQIVYWYNPLLWLVRRQVHHLRELCCDATVARLLKHKISAYRQTLLETARRFLSTSVEPGLGLLGLFEDSNRLLVRLNWLEKPTWRYRKMKNTFVLAVIVVMLACVLPMAQVQRTVAAEEDEAKLEQTQAELQQKQQELQFKLQELEAKRLELQAQLQALDTARQAEKAKKAEVLEKKVKVTEQRIQVQEKQVQARQMQDWQKQIDQWQNSDAMKNWRKEIEQWAQKKAMISLGKAEGPLPPAPAMPPMPAMPAAPMTAMPPVPAPPVAPVPVVEAVSEVVIVPAPPETQQGNISISVPHEEHRRITVLTPQASAHAVADADASVIEDSTSQKTHSIVIDGSNTIRSLQSIKEKEKKGRCIIERIEAQTLPFSSGAVLNITNEDGVINVKGADVDTCQVQAIVTVQGPAMETVRLLSKQVSFDMDQTDKGIDIAVVEPKKMPRDYSANVALQILVPRNINLSIKHEDGAVQLKDLQGQVQVQVEDGAISCEDIMANTSLVLQDGKIIVKRSTFSSGSIAMEDGQIECEDIKGSLACALEDGKVKIVYADDVPEVCSIAVMVVDGGVEFSAPSAMFGPDAPKAAKRVNEGAEWTTVAGNRTIVLKTQDGSVNVQKR